MHLIWHDRLGARFSDCNWICDLFPQKKIVSWVCFFLYISMEFNRLSSDLYIYSLVLIILLVICKAIDLCSIILAIMEQMYIYEDGIFLEMTFSLIDFNQTLVTVITKNMITINQFSCSNPYQKLYCREWCYSIFSAFPFGLGYSLILVSDTANKTIMYRHFWLRV